MDTDIEADTNPGMITGTATSTEEAAVIRMAMATAMTMAMIATVVVIVIAAGITRKMPQTFRATYSSSFNK
jgi:hypothetical protein